MSPERSRSFWPKTLIEMLEALVHLSVLCGGVFIFFQYSQAQSDTRTERTLNYVANFEQNDTAAGKAQRLAGEFLWRHAESIQELKKLSKEQRAEMYNFVFWQAVTDDAAAGRPIKEPVNEIVRFMDGLWICIEQNLCDRLSAESYFSDYAARFVRNFGPLLSARRATVPDYGEGIENIAHLPKEMP